MCLSDISFLPGRRVPPAKQQCQETGNEKEDAVHDAESETCFQHCTILVHVDGQTIDTTPDTAEYAKGNATGVCAVSIDMSAIGFGNTTEFVYTGYESTDEAEVDEGDEEGIGTRAMICEESRNGPGSTEDGYDEEYEDVGRCKGIMRGVLMDEPGQHSKCRNLNSR